MDNEKINQLMHELKSLTYNWRSGSDSYNSKVINKEGVDRVEQVIRKFLLDNHDEKIGKLEAKVFMYEQIISKSNFAPMLDDHTDTNSK